MSRVTYCNQLISRNSSLTCLRHLKRIDSKIAEMIKRPNCLRLWHPITKAIRTQFQQEFLVPVSGSLRMTDSWSGDSKHSRLLWVSAGPGCGKSVLSRSLIDERRVCTNAMASTVCYFSSRMAKRSVPVVLMRLVLYFISSLRTPLLLLMRS